MVVLGGEERIDAMITWRLMASDVRRHPGRSTLTLLSIAIGIASVIAASLATATTRNAYRRMYEEIAGRAALQVTAAANGTFPQEFTKRLVKLLGVRAAVPSYQRATRSFSTRIRRASTRRAWP